MLVRQPFATALTRIAMPNPEPCCTSRLIPSIAPTNELLVQLHESELHAAETVRAEEHTPLWAPYGLGVEAAVPSKSARVLAFYANKPKVAVPL